MMLALFAFWVLIACLSGLAFLYTIFKDREHPILALALLAMCLVFSTISAGIAYRITEKMNCGAGQAQEGAGDAIDHS